jgi:hypothetical protein
MTITIDLTPEQSERLADVARQRGVSAEEFAREAVVESLGRDGAVRAAAANVLEKNAELYRRLAR